MESQHTPGPWEMERRDWQSGPSRHRIYISGDKHEYYDEDHDTAAILSTAVCIVEGNATSRETTAANARLIKASPIMLALLERYEALDIDQHATDAEWSQFRRDVHAVIAEVTGGTP